MNTLSKFPLAMLIFLLWLALAAPLAASSTDPTPGPHMDRHVTLRLAFPQALPGVLLAYNAHVLDVLTQNGVFLLHLDGPDVNAQEIVSQMRQDERIVWAELNFISKIPEADPYEMGGWGGYDSAPYYEQYAGEAINLAWAQERWRGAGTTIAILDTGIQLDHPELAPHLVAGMWDFVDEDAVPADEGNGLDDDHDGYPDGAMGHGTHVAGIINLVAPEADLLILRVLNDEGQGHLFDVAQAIRYAVDKGADVINMSMGAADMSMALQAALDYAAAAGVVVVAAAGNLDSQLPQYPAALPGVVGVAALDESSQKADFSNYGDWVDIAAPGVSIYSTYPISGYGWWSGTSMATPFVAGQLALVRQAAPALSATAVVSQVLQTAVSVDALNPQHAGLLGSGLADALRSTGCYWADVAPDATHDVQGHACDYQIDVLDVQAVAAAWGGPAGDARDMDGDGDVDIGDMMQVASRWGWMP